MLDTGNRVVNRKNKFPIPMDLLLKWKISIAIIILVINVDAIY